MAKLPWSKFFWSDWSSDEGLKLCSLSAQGLWMRMLCVCARHEPKGYLAINGNPLTVTEIARLAGISETEVETLIAELDRNGVFSRNRKGVIYSRRMVSDEKRSKEGRKHKVRGIAQAAENKEKKSRPSRVPIRGPSPQKPEARIQSNRDTNVSLARPPDRFQEFWDVYPHRNGAKKGRAKAEAKFHRLIKSGSSDQAIIDGARRYTNDRQVLDGYAKDPLTWLNGSHWSDDVETKAPPHSQQKTDGPKPHWQKMKERRQAG